MIKLRRKVEKLYMKEYNKLFNSNEFQIIFQIHN